MKEILKNFSMHQQRTKSQELQCQLFEKIN